ncbi:hypothetical protein C8J57DRAFT_196656 [Mycena rebaudengoi]|nr:hypothetical protein C8J57DRAFT_196656 [Mycena rebaudengoi]
MPLGAVLVTPTVKYLEPHWATFLLQFEHEWPKVQDAVLAECVGSRQPLGPGEENRPPSLRRKLPRRQVPRSVSRPIRVLAVPPVTLMDFPDDAGLDEDNSDGDGYSDSDTDATEPPKKRRHVSSLLGLAPVAPGSTTSPASSAFLVPTSVKRRQCRAAPASTTPHIPTPFAGPAPPGPSSVSAASSSSAGPSTITSSHNIAGSSLLASTVVGFPGFRVSL